MSHYDYDASKRIALENYPFYALIMAAMRQADSFNFGALRQTFPEIHAELQARYDAPGGYLPGEPMPDEMKEALEAVRTIED